MRCAACGAGMEGKTECAKCGSKATNPADNLEVHYKEFKMSEFLEIRSKPRGSASEGRESQADHTRKSPFPARMKKGLSILVPILFALAFVAAVIYLFRRHVL